MVALGDIDIGGDIYKMLLYALLVVEVFMPLALVVKAPMPLDLVANLALNMYIYCCDGYWISIFDIYI